MIDVDELYYDAISLLERMIAIPSVSREENAVADMLQNQLTEWQLSPKRSGNNLWCLSPDFSPAKPTILLNSHIDTVKPVAGWTLNPFAPTHSDNRLYGLGSNDAGASVVSLLAAFRWLTQHEQHYNLIFLASCEEEVSGRGGIESILPMLPNINVAIVGEPTGLQPALAEKGLWCSMPRLSVCRATQPATRVSTPSTKPSMPSMPCATCSLPSNRLCSALSR